MIFPWQADQWQHLWRAKQSNHLPHALLFVGVEGTGKTKFAETFTRAILCQQVTTEGVYCNTCHACRLIEGNAHPNVLWIRPEENGHVIKVDQIRVISDFVNQSSLNGEYRVVLINPANFMNINAANALLKTLEEPTTGALIILISSQIERLPRTIISRCQRIAFPRPHREEALSWLKSQLDHTGVDADLLLKLAHGAPLAAVKAVEDNFLPLREEIYQALTDIAEKRADPIKFALQWQMVPPLQVLDLILSWVMDLIRLQLGGSLEGIINQDFNKQLLALRHITHLTPSAKLMEYLLTIRKQLCGSIHLNKQLVIESMLIRWLECTK